VITNKALKRLVTYYKTYEELFGRDAADRLIEQAKDSVQIVLESLENENNYNAFTFLGM
jgi:hypothetical protein